jgi:hypothetical protein
MSESESSETEEGRFQDVQKKEAKHGKETRNTSHTCT